MYYVLGCFGPETEDRAGIGDILNTDVNWQTGSRFPDAPPVPVEVALNPDFPGLMMPMFDSGILLFSERMVNALHESGVDNLDVYDAVIRDIATGKTYADYKAVNIIGSISCADLSRSNYTAASGTPMIDTDFDGFTIDETKIGDLLMFRMAECITAILVHEKVRRGLERHAIPYLDFYEPADWIG